MARRESLNIQIQGPRLPVEVSVDVTVKMAYVRVRHGTVSHTIEHAEGVLLDVDSEGRLLGFEVMLPANASGIRDVSEKYLRDATSSEQEYRDAVKLVERVLSAA